MSGLNEGQTSQSCFQTIKKELLNKLEAWTNFCTNIPFFSVFNSADQSNCAVKHAVVAMGS